MKYEFISPVINNRLQSSTSKAISKVLEGLEGKRVVITIDKFSAKRSGQQNRYLHLLFSIFCEALNELGNDFNMIEVKELCKAKFSMIDVIDKTTGEILGKRIKGTSEMNKTELMDFIENVIRWSADTFSIVLPYPNEQLEIE